MTDPLPAPAPAPLPLPLRDTVPAVDRAIITALVTDGRITVARLAERTGTSPSTAGHHLDRLLDDRSVTVTGMVVPALLGNPVLAYLVVTTDTHAAAVARALAGVDAAEWITAMTDLTTVIMQVSAPDNAALVALVDTAVRTTPGVRSVSVRTVLRGFTTAYSTMGTAPSTGVVHPVPMTAPTTVDAADRAILLALQADGRASFTALAETCGLSVPATRNRVLRLLDRGLVTVRCKIAPELFDLHRGASLMLTCTGDTTRTARALARIPEAMWVMQLTGDRDLSLEVRCHDDAHVAEVYRQVTALDTVGEVDLLLHDTMTKRTTRWSH